MACVGEVSVLVAKMALASVRKAGVDLVSLTAGLSFDELSLRWRYSGRVSWDDFCTFCERAEIALGGREKTDRFTARTWRRMVPPQLGRLLGTMISAKDLYRFVALTIAPALFPNIDMGFEDLAGDRVRVTARLQPGERSCVVFFRESFVTLAKLVHYLGLPPAMLEFEELTDRGCAAVFYLPPSEALLARARRTSALTLEEAAVWLVGFFAGEARAESERLSALLDRPSQTEPGLLGRLVAFERARRLTVKQAEVLALVVRGLSNKEIARELDCAENTIEFHVTQILRKTSTGSRAQLIASFWAQPPATSSV